MLLGWRGLLRVLLRVGKMSVGLVVVGEMRRNDKKKVLLPLRLPPPRRYLPPTRPTLNLPLMPTLPIPIPILTLATEKLETLKKKKEMGKAPTWYSSRRGRIRSRSGIWRRLGFLSSLTPTAILLLPPTLLHPTLLHPSLRTTSTRVRLPSVRPPRMAMRTLKPGNEEGAGSPPSAYSSTRARRRGCMLRLGWGGLGVRRRL
ncbi:hypothetical protein C8R46DRAFT_1092067, partial [Mycena filopes]